jgi:hypothetical protein
MSHERIVPWVISIGIHGGLIALGFLLTWTVISLSDEEPTRVEAEFYNLNYDPLVMAEAGPRPADEPRSPAAVEQLARRAEQLSGAEVAPLSVLAEAALPAASAFSSAPSADEAAFMGLRTTDARRIVYLIDASGSMIASFRVVLDELARSLEALSERQSFAIIFFQAGEALAATPAARLVAATDSARHEALAWTAANVVPQGRSDPLAAFETALTLEPDVIFLLSENITGAGRFEIDQADLLARLETLNPAEERGRRRSRINCVQFLSTDPLETLLRIAERHGGASGYRFLDPVELGVTP